jgi:hypothetical protein
MTTDVQESTTVQKAETAPTSLAQTLGQGVALVFGMAFFGYVVGTVFVLFVQMIFGGFNGWTASEVRDAYTNEVVKLSSSAYVFQGMRWGTIIGGSLGILGAILLLLGDQFPVAAGDQKSHEEADNNHATSPK